MTDAVPPMPLTDWLRSEVPRGLPAVPLGRTAVAPSPNAARACWRLRWLRV